MTKDRTARHVPILLSIVLALMLAIVPLPEVVDPYRPDWITLTLVYWAMNLPRTYSVGSAWIVGLVLDVAHGTLLGQHALALAFVVYITVKFHLQLRQFPLSQLSATVFALLALYQFILFWVNGVAGIHASATTYWGPVLSGTIAWPILYTLFSSLRYRARSRA